MGAAQKQGQTGQTAELNLQHPYLKNCKTRTRSNQIDMLATVSCQLPTFNKWKKDLQSTTLSPQTRKYMLLPKAFEFDEGSVCSTSGELTLCYSYYPRLLITEIANRKAQKRKFTEEQLWHLLYVLTVVKYELSLCGQSIGNPHPYNIFLNGAEEVKVACLYTWPQQVNSYRRAILEQQCGYLSPQDIKRLQLGALDNKQNIQSQLFSIGLIILSSATLTMQQDLYNLKEKQFEEQEFYSRLTKFQQDKTYSFILRAVITNLLQAQPFKRMNIDELHSLLAKHSQNIVAKKVLLIDNLNLKLQLTIKQMTKVIPVPQTPLVSPKGNYPSQDRTLPAQDSSKPQIQIKQTPFEKNIKPTPVDLEIKKQVQNKGIQESKLFEHSQNPMPTQIWNNSQTSIGQLNQLIQPKRDGFDHNSLITPTYHPERIRPSSLGGIYPQIKNEVTNITLQNKSNLNQQIKLNSPTKNEISQTYQKSQYQIARKLQDLRQKYNLNPIHSLIHAKQTQLEQLNPTIPLSTLKVKKQNSQTFYKENAQPNSPIIIEQFSNQQIQFNENFILASSKQASMQIAHQQELNSKYHTYVQAIVDGNFQECWQQIIVLLKDPTQYSSIINPAKVMVRVMQDCWSLKIGPAIFDVILNKQQGKILLRNCAQESLCEGEMLGGVYKDEEKKSRIWFNSAYYYKEKRIPSRDLVEESLKKCKGNIERRKQ